MNKFNFNGDWCPVVILPEFGKLNHEDLFSHLRNEKLSNEFKIQIDDFENNDPDPLESQLNTIDYILNNEQNILESLFNYIKEVVYPAYEKFQPKNEYPECYPELNSVIDLRELISLSELIIYNKSKSNFSYSVFSFNCRLDYEHGLCITMHKDRCIDWAEMGNLDQEKIDEENSEIVLRTKFDNTQEKEFGLFLPNNKYGTLKPWQKDANKSLPSSLLFEDKIDELKNYFSRFPESSKEYAEKLVLNSLWWSKSREVLGMLLEISKVCPFGAMEHAVQQKDLELINYLFSKNYNIDNKGIGGTRITDVSIRNYLRNKNQESKEIMELFFQKGGQLENTDFVFSINERENGNDRESSLELIKMFRDMESNVKGKKNWLGRILGK